MLRRDLARSSAKVPVNGKEIFYQKVGIGPNVVLLMPGVFGSGDTDFEPQIQGMNKEKFTLIAWDPPGIGMSVPPKRSFSSDYLVRDAADAGCLMENLGYDKYSLLGWSDGGVTAGILAATRPGNIDKLIMWGANSYVTREDCEMWEKIRDVSKWSDRRRAPLLARIAMDDLQRLWSENLDLCRELVENHEGELFSKKLKSIKAPTLIIHGMKDQIVPLHHAEYLRDHIKGAILECWQDGKHNLHLRFPDRFNARVEAFLTENHSNL